MVDTKTCNECKATKPRSEFNRRAVSVDGLQYKCKACDRVLNKRYRHLNPQKRRAYTLRTQFNITREERDALLASQGGACAICLSTESGKHDWATDHDHACCPGVGSCGECIRGILCIRCNTALGSLQDDPLVLQRAIDYLKRAA